MMMRVVQGPLPALPPFSSASLIVIRVIGIHSSLGLRGFDLRENEVTRFLFGGTIPRFTRTWFTRMDLLTEKVARIK